MKMKAPKGIRAWIVLCLMSVFLIGLTVSPRTVFATTTDDSEVETVGGLYDATTALTAYVNDVVGANANDKHNNQRVENPQNAGNAGAYVGYGDQENQDFVPFLTMDASIGSSSTTYDAWLDVTDSASGDEVYQYLRLGRTLADAGLDKTVTGSGTMTFTRMAGGVISIVVYVASQVVPVIFGLILTLLQKLNIFQLFANSVVMSNQYWKDAYGTPLPVLGPLVQFISGAYDALANYISWAVIVPILFAVTAVSVLLLRRNASTTIGNLVKRVVFIAIGVPILAGLYTATLDKLQDSMTDGSEMSTAKIVSATFVDFESWVTDTNLNITDDLNIESTMDDASNVGGTASDEFLRQVRDTATRINANSNSNMPSAGFTTEYGSVSDELWNDNGHVTVTGSNDSYDTQGAIVNLLFRYLSNDTYSSSAWATKVASEFPDGAMGSAADDTGSDTVRAMFNATDEKNDWMKRETTDNNAIWSGRGGTDMDWVGESWNVFNNGTLCVGSGSVTDDSGPMTWTGHLSDASMYNYLSTAFNDSSVVIYSPGNSVSEHTQYAHSSVNSVGTGLLGGLFLLNMWVCLGVLGLLGCYFAISTGFNTLKTSFRLLTSIPTAMLGLLKSIVQVLTYFILMIGQLFIGAFMYTFMSDLLVVFATLLENLAGDITSSGSTTTVSVLGGRLISLWQTVLPESLYHSRMGICLMIGSELLLLLFVFAAVWKYRRALVRCYDFAWYHAFKAVTASCYQDAFEEIWRQKHQVGRPDVVHTGNPVSEVFAFLKPETQTGKEVWSV